MYFFTILFFSLFSLVSFVSVDILNCHILNKSNCNHDDMTITEDSVEETQAKTSVVPSPDPFSTTSTGVNEMKVQ